MLVNKKGKIEDREKAEVSDEESVMLKLPDMADVDDKDITLEKPYFNTTWKATIDKSAQQVKWFIRRGYDVVLQANTQRYIEIYLEREDTIKRIVITPETISIVDVEELPTTSPEQYIKENRLYN